MLYEVDGAGGVEGFLRGADRESRAQDGVLVAVAGGGVDREAEGAGGAAVAQPEQRDLLAVAERAGDVRRSCRPKLGHPSAQVSCRD